MKFIILLSLLSHLAWAAPDCENCLDPNLPLQNLLNSGLNASLQTLAEISSCSIPDVGSAVRHDQTANTENKIPNNSHFVLRRPSQKLWVVEFDAQFTAISDVTADEAAGMRNKVEQCFAQAAPAMLGPDGNQMRLSLRGASGSSPVPPVIPITVKRAGRGDASTFSLTFTCATIIHEFLHHAGLCDEYPEGDIAGVVNAAACRVVVPNGSIMSASMGSVYDDAVGAVNRCDFNVASKWTNAPAADLSIEMSRDANDMIGSLPDRTAITEGWCSVGSYSASTARPPLNDYGIRWADIPRGFEMDFPGRNVASNLTSPIPYRLTCRCPANNSTCLEKIAGVRTRLTESYLPENRRYRCPTYTTSGTSLSGSMEIGTMSDRRTAGFVEFRNPPRENRSLLHPAHFMRILRGSCRSLDANNLYDQCAQFAYRHSQPDNTPADCSNIPAACKDSLQYLGGRPVSR